LDEKPAEKQRSASKDFIDIYLEKMDETKDENSRDQCYELNFSQGNP
jgi:hypothetical protein